MKFLIILYLQLITTLAHADTVWCSLASSATTEKRIVLTATNELLFEELENGELHSRTVLPENRTDIWDGHMSGLITAPGFSMYYEDHFGCVRNVEVALLANRSLDLSNGQLVEKVSFPLCAGLSQSFCNR